MSRAQPLHLQGRCPSGRFPRRLRGDANAPHSLCSLLLEQESRLGAGEKLDGDRERGSQKGDSEQRPLSGREIPAGCGLHWDHLRPLPTGPRPGGAVSPAGASFVRRAEPLWDPGGSCSAGQGRGPRARDGEHGAAGPRPGHHRLAPRSPSPATSARGRGERVGESVPVATQRPGDVRQLSLVPRVTGPAAGPATCWRAWVSG